MGTCSACGNTYVGTFDVTTHTGRHLVFDSIECAASMIAPACDRCGCMILGHGVQADEEIFCCANCARSAGVHTARDNAPHDATDLESARRRRAARR